MDKHLKFVTTRFRLAISDLAVHYYKYKTPNETDLIRPLCKNSRENEVHFVLKCPALMKIRETFIKPKYYRNPSMFKLSLLMSSPCVETTRSFSLFLYKAFKFREMFIS